MNKDNKAISIHYYDGPLGPVADGVRVRTLDEDFVVHLYDLMKSPEEELEEPQPVRLDWFTIANEISFGSFDTFTRKQWGIIGAYIHEINEVIQEAGGEPIINGYYWCKDCMVDKPAPYGWDDRSNAWIYNGYYGTLENRNKEYRYKIRPRVIVEEGGEDA